MVQDRTLHKQPTRAVMDNTMMAQVLKELKQMNKLLINNRAQLQPPSLPWYRNYIQPVPIPKGEIPQWYFYYFYHYYYFIIVLDQGALVQPNHMA